MSHTLINLIVGVINFYAFAIIVYVLMSWIPDKGEGFAHDLRSVLGSICEPYLSLFRKIIPAIGGIDFSPILAILVLQLLTSFIVRL